MSELGTRLSKAIDCDADNLLLEHRTKRQEQITQGKSRGSYESSEKQPEKDSTTPARHGQAKHQTKGKQYRTNNPLRAASR